MKTHAVLYTKPNCPACKMTTKWFDRLGYPYQNTYYGNADKSNTIDVRTCLVSAESGRIVENRLRSLSCQIIQAIFL
ncbi:glutaredoxin domain-containing protein, partial [Lacticaseibacillus paracasei]|nr:Glutaredoxin and related proteins [Lacticaseibacillus casei]